MVDMKGTKMDLLMAASKVMLTVVTLAVLKVVN